MDISSINNNNINPKKTYNLSRNQLGSKDIDCVFKKYDIDGDGKLNSCNKNGVNELDEFLKSYDKMSNQPGAAIDNSNPWTTMYNSVKAFFSGEKDVNKIYRDGQESQANGVLENSKQGKIGDCWLLSQLNSLKGTDFGKQAIKEAIGKNSDGSYTVNLKGVNESYTFSPEEIQAAIDTGKYSTGDLDYLLLELAFEKHYDKAYDELSENDKSIQNKVNDLKGYNGGLSIEGGQGASGNTDVSKGSYNDKDLGYLLGIDTHNVVFEPEIVQNPENTNEILRFKSENKNDVAVTFGSSYDVEKETEFGGLDLHEYSVNDVNTDENGNVKNIDVINPWDNSRVIDKNLDDFSRVADNNVHISTTDKNVADRANNLRNSMHTDNYIKKFNDENSTWSDLFIPDNVDTKEIIGRCGGMKNYMDKYTEKAAQDDAELTPDDLKTVTKNTYIETFGFSEEDAREVTEHPKMLKQYCTKYGYDY